MKASDLLPKYVIDEKAETILEMVEANHAMGEASVRTHVKKLLTAGRIEKVTKHNPKGVLVPAYRPKK